MALKGKNHENKLSVFLGNLHFNTTEEDVRSLFSKVHTLNPNFLDTLLDKIKIKQVQ